MVHYNSQLANGLAENVTLTDIVSSVVSPRYFDKKVRLVQIDIGDTRYGAAGRLPSLPHMWHRIRSVGADIYHFSSTYYWHLLVLPALRSKRVVLTVHDPVLHEGATLARAWIERALRRRADGLIVHTPTGERQLRQQGITKPVAVVPHGDYTFLSKLASQQVTASKEILFFGRIQPYKGLQYLLDVAPHLEREFPDWQLVIAGSGDLSGYRGLKAPNVTVVNRFLSDEETATLFQRASMVILPYLSATQSGVLQLTLAFGKPAIVTAVDGLIDGPAAHAALEIVEPRNSAKLYEAIRKVALAPPDWRPAGDSGDADRFNRSWRDIGKSTAEFYRRLRRPASPSADADFAGSHHEPELSGSESSDRRSG